MPQAQIQVEIDYMNPNPSCRFIYEYLSNLLNDIIGTRRISVG